ncbi:SDR family oxidoreductase [Horticoccus luteus]|uniref:SDR family oxidoreductase n=1 Tax=Horticoccus luteus TaxID=2862869 RepID=A0A8F9TVD7_9BACT|nr:SDR family oxidoreductase [Horticoccus luteus]QYM78815.1 SDR family oxidoreductase [Horticoccus luteus]
METRSDFPRAETVVITGASAGVGRATAREFARRGARLGLLARGRERLEATQREVEDLGGRAVILAADVADPQTTETLAQMTEDAFGPIDIWVNNAMASVYSKIVHTPPEEMKRVTEVTYLGYVYGTQAALRRMLKRDRGMIVQVGSALAYRSIPQQSAYCAAKHAIHGFTDSLRSELIADHSRVRVTMVQLPSMNTPQFVWVKSRLPQKAKPPAPIYQPEVAARTIYWAAHHDRREVYLGFMTAAGIKANKVWPGLLDHYLVGRSFSDTHEPRDPNQPDNLFSSAPGEWAAHGPFDADAQDHSWQIRLSRHRTAATLCALGAAGAVAALLWRRHHRASTMPRQLGRPAAVPQ